MMAMQQLLSEFGQKIGIPHLAPNPQGEVVLRLETGASLGITPCNSDLVVHWAEPVGYGASSLLLRAMKRTGAARDGRFAIQVGLRRTSDGTWLVLATRLEVSSASARDLYQAAEYLRQWLERLDAPY